MKIPLIINRKITCLAIMLALACSTARARIKLVALPERGATSIRLDNPNGTLIEEERILTLQKGVNKVDFSWKGVSITPDSIILKILSHPDKVTLLNVSYPPNEAALVWEIYSPEALEEKVRISYLLSNIDKLVTYKLLADKDEKTGDLSCFVVLRNFSGEDFDSADVMLGDGEPMTASLNHEETRQTLFFRTSPVAIKKIWEFDATKLPWDPEKENTNVGIPVRYEIENSEANKLGKQALWTGKTRVFQDDGQESVIFSGEDQAAIVPVGENMKIRIGDSRDIVVTQQKMKETRVNVRRNNNNNIVLYDTDEEITAEIENFKDDKAVLTMIQFVPGQWEMKECNMDYEKKDAETIEFNIELEPNSKKELKMRYVRKNIRPHLHNTSMTQNVF